MDKNDLELSLKNINQTIIKYFKNIRIRKESVNYLNEIANLSK